MKIVNSALVSQCSVFFSATVAIAILCASGHALASGPESSAAGDSTAQMQSLYPPKTADKSLSTRPQKPDLVAPAFEAKISGSAQLEWKAAAGADGYHVQVATDPDFKWLVMNEVWVAGTNLTVSDLKPDQHYYWRVASLKKGNTPGYTKSMFSKLMFSTYQ